LFNKEWPPARGASPAPAETPREGIAEKIALSKSILKEELSTLVRGKLHLYVHRGKLTEEFTLSSNDQKQNNYLSGLKIRPCTSKSYLRSESQKKKIFEICTIIKRVQENSPGMKKRSACAELPA